jgi:DNA repair protein RecO (recombination protein O)
MTEAGPSPVEARVDARARAADDVDEMLASEAIAALGASPPPARSASRPARKRAAPRETRIVEETAFVLHGYPYKETSLIVDVFTRAHGRVALVARGAKRPRSALRGMLLAFQPLSVGWIQSRARSAGAIGSSGGDLRTLTRAEWLGGLMPLRGEALMSGFYLNELLQKLLARDDPHELLFDAYAEALAALAGPASPAASAAPVLRHFETVLLRETGYALQGTHTADGDALDADATYRYVPERGPVLTDGDEDTGEDNDAAIVSGRTLLDMAASTYANPVTLMQAKRLTRHLLQHHLSGQLLQTRRLVLDLQSLEEGFAR